MQLSKEIFVLVLFVVSGTLASAQSAHKARRNADLFYDQGEYLEAEEDYRKANAARQDAEVTYNLGNTIYQQERLDEAIMQYQKAAQDAETNALRSKAYYNLGNAHMQAQQFDKSIEAYINALKADPEDLDTKKNLTYALRQLRQQQRQQQQQQQQSGGEDEEERDEEQEQEQKQQQQQQQDIEQPNEEEESESQQKQELTPEEAEELLRIIEAEDQRVQGKLKKANAKPRKPKKDW